MRRSTCLNYPAALEATTRGAGTRNDSPIAIVRRGSADNDATCEDPVISMDEVERRAQYARAANGLDDVASIDTALSAWPTSDQLLQARRTRRAFTLSKIIASAIRAGGALARWAHARYRQRRQAKAIYDALRQLDDRTLHDLGFDRSEIWSVAAEATGAAEYTRAQVFDGVDR